MEHFQSCLSLGSIPFVISIVALFGVFGCSKADLENTSKASNNCPALTGTAWVPNVSGVAPSNHDSSVTVSETVVTASGPLTGLAQAAPVSREVRISIDMSEDLGPSGSLSLIAQVQNFPAALSGSAFAYLVSLTDGAGHDFVNLTRSGGNDCSGKGYYTCTNGTCTGNSSCTINWPSAFFSRSHWEERQSLSSSAKNYPSVNIFPTCNWSGGSGQSVLDPSCAFNSNFNVGQTSLLRYGPGVKYTASYVLLTDSYSNVNFGTSTLKVNIIKKKSSNITSGAFDLNFILVGSTNVQGSRTTKGKQNLDTMATQVVNYYAQTNPNLKIGTIRGIEWGCDGNGDQYASPDSSELGTVFAAAGSVIPSGLDKTALNVLLVSRIEDDSSGSDSNLQILGQDGAIGGPVLNGTAVSGMAVSTFDYLDQYNQNCPSSVSVCSLAQIDEGFFQLSEAVVHEMGHFFGLNHIDERDGSTHDFVRDTPICTATDNFGSANYVSSSSCYSRDTNILPGSLNTCKAAIQATCGSYNGSFGPFCPEVIECGFNYAMWWLSKPFIEGIGSSDGVLFSEDQSRLIRYHPIVQ